MTRRLSKEEIRAAQEPILRDLRAIGIELNTLFTDFDDDVRYVKAIPILIEHMERGGYPDRVMNGLGIALASKKTQNYWAKLCELYRAAHSDEERQGLANAVDRAAKRSNFEDLRELTLDESVGDSRLIFLRTLKRIDRERGLAFIQTLTDDPVLGQESLRILRGRSPSE